MEPISPGEHDNFRPQNFTEDELDKLLRDLNEFERAILMHGPAGVTSIMDFVDSIFTDSIGNWNVAHSPQSHFTRVLHDFEEYESTMLPPCQRASAATTNLINAQSFAFATEIQESQVMIEEMAKGTEDFVVETTFHDATPCLNTTFNNPSHCDIGGTSGLEINSFAGSISGVSFHASGSMSATSFGASSVRYFHCRENSSWCKKADNRRRKRRYKGVETEEDTARRLERTKIRNREAAAKAHQKKQAHEANLKSKLFRLRKKNKFLKNFLMFLGDDKNASSPIPLRRTISGPV